MIELVFIPVKGKYSCAVCLVCWRLLGLNGICWSGLPCADLILISAILSAYKSSE